MTDTAAPDATPSPSWGGPETEERVEALLGQMTIDEKIAYVTGEVNWNYGFYARALERLGLPAIQMADGPAGVRINMGDVHAGTATMLPAPIALAATWDSDLVQAAGVALGHEAQLKGARVLLALRVRPRR